MQYRHRRGIPLLALLFAHEASAYAAAAVTTTTDTSRETDTFADISGSYADDDIVLSTVETGRRSGSVMTFTVDESTGTSKGSTSVSVTLLHGTNKAGSTTTTDDDESGTATKTATRSGSQEPTSTESTTSAPEPTNTQPCNQYVEYCTRGYGNITYVGAHNSPFVRKSSAAANQHLEVETQLDDGIRMLQGQTHKVNNTLYYCHTSCDILNAGTVEDYLTRVVTWLLANPFEVITVLIGNGDFVDIEDYVEPLTNSGLADLAYIPDNRTVHWDQWPTLSDLILKGKRAIVFVDYKADQGKVEYMLDEFSYMWESPFSQTDDNFPCNVDRPDNMNDTVASNFMYMANHNLNVDFSFAGSTNILVPNSVQVNQTNNVTGFGSLGLMANNCRSEWDRPPTFLLVDFYDAGEGTVFEVAAEANNVTYTGTCCGKASSPAMRIDAPFLWTVLQAASVAALVLCL